jgi:hypothetical protein
MKAAADRSQRETGDMAGRSPMDDHPHTRQVEQGVFIPPDQDRLQCFDALLSPDQNPRGGVDEAGRTVLHKLFAVGNVDVADLRHIMKIGWSWMLLVPDKCGMLPLHVYLSELCMY